MASRLLPLRSPRGWRLGVFTVCALSLATAAAHAASLVPGPGQVGHDVGLAAKADRLQRQVDAFNARPFGAALDVFIFDEGNRQLVRNWMASDLDFESFAGVHPYAVVDLYSEHGDLGNFGGFATAGEAWRYMVLREQLARGEGDPAALAAARARVEQLLEVWHVYTAITGVPGVFARGVRRITSSEDGAPPLPPGSEWQDAGSELHPDYSGVLPEWEWMGDTSKDQAIGFALALGALWDAVAGDDSFAPALEDRLRDDALALAAALMAVHRVGGAILGQNLDMIIVDRDGEPVRHFGLNPQVINEPNTLVGPGSAIKNGFNALLGLGFIKVLHHITGDPTIAAFYYDDLIDTRRWHEVAFADGLSGFATMYLGDDTNYSNVNMAALAVFNLARYEADPELRAFYAAGVSERFYAPGKAGEPQGAHQSWFDFIEAGLGLGGTNNAAAADGLATLTEFHDAPYFDDPIENCDAGEAASGTCVGADGTTIQIDRVDGNQVYARDPVPMRIRPPNDFEWRSSPYALNGGGVHRLNPAGDFRGAYWLGRLLQRTTDNRANLSPVARDRSNAQVGAGGPILGTGGNGGDGGDGGNSGAAGGEGGAGATGGTGAGGEAGAGGAGATGTGGMGGTGGTGGIAGMGGTPQAGGGGGSVTAGTGGDGTGGNGGHLEVPARGCASVEPTGLTLLLALALRRRKPARP